MSAKHFVSLLLLVVVIASPLHTRAQAAPDNRTILVLVKDLPGAPTPEQIVNYSNTWPHAIPPPLQAFSVKDPEVANYLMADRATGDFLTWLQANPNSVRKKLEDYVLVTFASTTDIPDALTALLADPDVDSADVPLAMDFQTAARTGPEVDVAPHALDSTQYGWDDLDLAAAWQITGGGYALVAQIDMGLDQTHPALEAFNGTTYVGGNFLPAASKDVGLTGKPTQNGFDPNNVDEAKAEWIGAGACTAVGALMPPDHLGHGTHVAGLLGASGASGLGVQGTCKRCGLAAYRSVFLNCSLQGSSPEVLPQLNPNAADRGKTEAVDAGAQALSLSIGATNASDAYNCTGNRDKSSCLTLAYAISRDAADRRVIG